MIHLSVAVGQFFKILLTAMFTGAIGLLLWVGLAALGITAVVLLLRVALRKRRK